MRLICLTNASLRIQKNKESKDPVEEILLPIISTTGILVPVVFKVPLTGSNLLPAIANNQLSIDKYTSGLLPITFISRVFFSLLN